MPQGKKQSITYSIDEVKERMEQYLDVSEQRLRARLRDAWKKRTSFKTAAYGREKTSLFRAGAR